MSYNQGGYPGGYGGGAPPQGPPRCQLGHEIAVGASYCPQGHPIAIDAMPIAPSGGDPGGGYPAGGYPQAGGYAPQQGYPQQGGYAPPQQDAYAPQQGGYAPPQHQGGYAPPGGGHPGQADPGGYGGGGYAQPPQQPGGYAPPQQGYAPPQQDPYAPQHGGYAQPQGYAQPNAQPSGGAGYGPPDPGGQPPVVYEPSPHPPPLGPTALRGFVISYQSSPQGEFWPLFGGRMAVGRANSGETVDIALNDATISSKHAAIVTDGQSGSVVVEDRGSTNGTYVNEEHIGYSGRRELKDGDKLRFGGFTTYVKIVRF